MKKKLLFIFILLCTISLVGCGTKNNDKKSNNKSKNEDEVINTKASSFDELQLPNNYKVYGASEAMKQDWYNDIAYIEKKNDGSFFSYYGYADDDHVYKIPDAIIFQGSYTDKNNDKIYEEFIIKKSEFDTKDGYKFIDNFCDFNLCDDGDNVILAKYVLNLNDEGAEKYRQYSKASDDEKSKYLANSWDGFEPNYQNKDFFMDLYDGMSQGRYHFYISTMEKYGEISRIMHYTIHLAAYSNSDAEYRMILVYDDLKANVLVNEQKDGVYYNGEYIYHSGIIDEEARQAYDNYKKANLNF